MKKRSYIFWIVVVLALVIIFSPLRNQFRRILLPSAAKPTEFLSSEGEKTRNLFSIFSEIFTLKKQNEELSSKITSLNVDRSKIEELEYENALLKKELGFIEKNKESKLLPAKIIGRDPTSFLDRIMVDKGSEDGMKEGMAVVSGGVLIGQVKEIYPRESNIVLITSKNSIVLAMLQNSRSKGILRGGISGLVLENITQDVEFETGEYVITSGLDGQLPSGLLIGKASGTETSSSSDLFKNIVVESLADLSKLEIVFIMQ